MGIPSKEHFDTEAVVGEGHRYNHDCSNKYDKSLIVTRTREGWVWYCHRCKEAGMRDLSGRSMKEKAQFIRSLNVQPIKTLKDMRLPLDFTSEIPGAGLVYLYTRGLHDIDIKKWKIGYSPKYDRVIFPVYDGKKLVFYTGRTTSKVTKENPKYMNVYQSGRKEVYFIAKGIFNVDVVIVEDIVSAIRSSYTLDAFAMLSTHIPETLMLELANHYTTIYLWLDPDKRDKCVKLRRRYRAFGMNVRLIRSDKDPKFYDNKEIRRFIYGEE